MLRREQNLRFDDTNPSTEEEIYGDSILDTVRWLGANPSPTGILNRADSTRRLQTGQGYLHER